MISDCLIQFMSRLSNLSPHSAAPRRRLSFLLIVFFLPLLMIQKAEGQTVDYPGGVSPDSAVVGEIIELSAQVRNLGSEPISDLWFSLSIHRPDSAKIDDTHTDYRPGLIYWNGQASEAPPNSTAVFTARYCLGISGSGHWYQPGEYVFEYAAWKGQPGSPGAEQIGELQSETLTISAISTPALDVPILEYHRVYDETPNEYWVATAEFEAQMKALVAYGYEPVTTGDLYDYNYNGTTLPPKPVILTFDDGYSNLYTHAYPILTELGLFGEAFIITDYTGFSAASRRYVRLLQSEPLSYPHLIWPEIIEMAAGGMMFGSHTETHRDLTTLSDAELEAELRDSKQALLDNAGIIATSFSYPYGEGHDSQKIQQYLARFDYTTAVAAWGGLEFTNMARPLDLSRIYIYGPQPAEDPTSNGVSVNFDPAHPADFFMRQVDPTFPVPLISVDYVEFLDELGNPRGDNTFYRSELMRVRVHARNSGFGNDVTLTLKLDNDEGADPLVYDSHQASQDISRFFTATVGTAEVFEFLWQVPADAPSGLYDFLVEFHDSTYTLGFLSSGWTNTAFRICDKIHLLEPADGVLIMSPPTFTWESGCNDKFVVEFSASPNFTSPKRTPILSASSFTAPLSLWSSVPSGRRIYWRVFGADSSIQPIVINKSEEVWSFFKN